MTNFHSKIKIWGAGRFKIEVYLRGLIYKLHLHFEYTLRGRGVFDLGKVKLEFSVVSDRGYCQLPDDF